MPQRFAPRSFPDPRQFLRDAPMLVAHSSHRTEDHLVEAMTETLSLESPDTTAEALRALRLAYPHAPLALRLAAVAAAMDRPAIDPSGFDPRK